MFSKINVLGIVREHFRTLYNLRKNRISTSDLLLFVGVPIGTAVALVARGYTITTDGVNILLTSLSIFVGLLFNLLVLAHAMRGGERGPKRTPYERTLLREINTNLEFSILVSLLAICFLLVTVFAPGLGLTNAGNSHAQTAGAAKVVVGWLAGITYLLTTNFLLTLLMVLKRMHTLLYVEYEDLEDDAAVAARDSAPSPAPPRPAAVGHSLVPRPAD
jgi:hypothetical protein